LKKRAVTKASVSKLPQDFKSVAKRTGCDPGTAKFDKKLGKIAKAKQTKQR
jgi:hypothetical protein